MLEIRVSTLEFPTHNLNFHKCIHTLAPPYLYNNFMKRLNIHEHHTRNRDLFSNPALQYYLRPQDVSLQRPNVVERIGQGVKTGFLLEEF